VPQVKPVTQYRCCKHFVNELLRRKTASYQSELRDMKAYPWAEIAAE
jgi:hypothetical protein